MNVGIRNNNYWNLKCSDRRNPWKGTAGYDRAGHVIFHHPIFAARAVSRDLASKYLGGKRSIAEIMRAYSPASDTLGSVKGQARNDPDGAARFICAELDRRIGKDLYTPEEDAKFFGEDGSVLHKTLFRNFLEVLAIQECGRDVLPIDEHMLLAGIAEYERDFVRALAGRV